MKTRLNPLRALLLAAAALVVFALCPADTARAATHQGTMANLVVFVKFTDTAPQDDICGTADAHDRIKNMYDNADNSFSKYIHAISEGTLSIQNVFPQEKVNGSGETVFATLTLPNTGAYYAAGSLQTEGEMIREVAAAFADGTIQLDPGCKLDYQTAGLIDNLTIVPIGGDDLFYPHSTTYRGDEAWINGAKVYCYNILNAKTLIKDVPTSISGQQGTIAHEFLHTLGLPDLYRKDGSGAPAGMWSIMASAISEPQYPLEYCRELLGWISIPEITAAGQYTLRLPTTPDQWGGKYPTAYKIRTAASDSEFFVVEYRRDEAPGAVFDQLLTGSGLIVYRVDNTVQDLTNFEGGNYIYTLRPGVTDPESAADTVPEQSANNLVNNAAIDPDNGAAAYGSNDLSAPFTQNTIYYRGGKNSGIALRNISYSADRQLISFDISFADLSASDMWQPAGEIGGAGSTGMAIAPDGAGGLYATTMDTAGGTINLWQSSGSGFAKQASLSGVAPTADASLCRFGGKLYLFTMNPSFYPVVYAYENGGFTKALSVDGTVSTTATPVEYGGSLHLCYLGEDGKTLAFKKVAGSGGEIAPFRLGKLITNPAVCTAGGKLYAAFSIYPEGLGSGTAENTCRVYVYENGSWAQMQDLGVMMSNVHAMAGGDSSRFAVMAANTGGEKVLSVYDGGAFSWVDASAISDSLGTTLFYDGGTLYACTVDSGQNLVMYACNAGKLVKVGETIAERVNNAAAPSVALSGGKLYAAYILSGSNQVIVRVHDKAPADPDHPDNPGGETGADHTVALTVSGTVSNSTLYVDGKPVQASASGNTLTVTLPADGSAQTVVYYPTNASGVPQGMQVWFLYCTGGKYTAVRQGALDNLLSYNGFSIRISGDAGIRFKTGIAADVKAALTGAGLDGFQLVEYGTIVMTQSNMDKGYALVLGGEKVAGGRSYWTENGVTNDRVFETVDGRQRFTSVLVGLPATRYKTEFAFRGYIILQKDGVRYTLYGPPVARSIYYLAQRLLDRGDYAPGSAEDVFLRGIITNAV